MSSLLKSSSSSLFPILSSLSLKNNIFVVDVYISMNQGQDIEQDRLDQYRQTVLIDVRQRVKFVDVNNNLRQQ